MNNTIEINGTNIPSSEVETKPVKRRFTTAYKLNIVKQADKCNKPGEVGALLRREALYSSLLTTWRKQRDSGLLTTSSSSKSRRKSKGLPTHDEHNDLKKRYAMLEKKFKQAEAVIEVQKKVSEIFGNTLDPAAESEKI